MIASWHRYEFFTMLILALHCQVAFSQVLGEEDVFPAELRKRVNSIESFINRFNNREDLLGNRKPQDSVTDRFVAERTQYILSLFDHDKLRKVGGKEKDEFMEFIQSVNSLEHQICLDFYDSNWYATVKMDVLYHKEPKEITLILTVEQTKPKVSKWTIRGVKADFLSLNPRNNDTANIIPPNSHGTDFIGLPGNFSKTDNIANLTSKEIRFDVLSVFLYARQRKEIDFKVAKSVSYYFLQVPHWIIKVREFNRGSENSGWLVEDLIKADNAMKSTYVRQQLSINK
jgi:hypothetical protein